MSFRGVTYEPKNGRIVIPIAAVPEAVSHSFLGPIIQEV
jgi:hypothetical protein